MRSISDLFSREKAMSAQGLIIPQEDHGKRLVGLHDDDDARMNKCADAKREVREA